jgi:hypothetical protein
MTKHAPTSAELDAQAVIELPERVLLGYAVLDVAATAGNTGIVELIADQIFDDWQLHVLEDNSLRVTVGPTEDAKLGLFCRESLEVLSAGATARCRVDA